MMAAFTATPEMVLEPDESKPLAEAVANLASHYNIPGLDDKTLAWVGLIMVAGKVYVPRAIMIKQRLTAEAKTKKPPANKSRAPLKLVPTETEQQPFVDLTDTTLYP